MSKMPSHELFFWVAFFFITGTLAGAITISFHGIHIKIAFITITAALAALTLHAIQKPYALLALIIIAGGIYSIIYDLNRQSEKIVFGRETIIESVIQNAERHLDYQELRLTNGIVITADRYPEFSYGDRIQLEGTIRTSKSPLIRGYITARHTNITLVSRHNGSRIKKYLYAVREAFETNLKKILPSDRAAFLAGLTVGSTAEFSREFLADLRTTGTTHLVALSGSNISGITSAVIFALAWIIPKRRIFWPTIAIISLFTIMTGAESSLVRAAIMNSIVLFGARYERIHSARNAIIAAALLMAVWNPLIPAFDLGFQLSFAAVIGMAYLGPLMERRLPWINKNLVTALAAQAAVLPILAISVGRANPFSIIPNILVAAAIPYTVGIGFLAGIIGFISTPISFAPGWVANILLSYETGIIRLFAHYM